MIQQSKKTLHIFEIWGPARSVAKYSSRLGRHDVSAVLRLPTFRKNVLPSASESRIPSRLFDLEVDEDYTTLRKVGKHSHSDTEDLNLQDDFFYAETLPMSFFLFSELDLCCVRLCNIYIYIYIYSID
jgi:hypothetical protein